MNLSIVLPLRNQSQLTTLLSSLYDPSSPEYHHFLSVQEFADRFGPTPDDYQEVLDFARTNGFEVRSIAANRMTVSFTGTAGQVEKAFHVRMRRYQHPTAAREFFSPDREPSVPAGLPVRYVAGMDNYTQPVSMAKRATVADAKPADVQGSGPYGNYLPRDMRAAYYGGTALTGRGQIVGLVQFDGYDIADVIKTFNGEATLTSSGSDPVVNYKPSGSEVTYSIPIHNVLLDGATGASCQIMAVACQDGEQVLDIVQAIGMAPGLSEVRVYIGNNDYDIFSKIAEENLAKQVSVSWAWWPADPSSIDQFFQEMAAQGQSVFVASGDYGAYSPQEPWSFPAEDQYVTAVGGTHLTTDGPGGPLLFESAWAQSGGGPSPNGIAIPSWQAGVANSSNQASNTLRNVPDVSMEADFDNYNCNLGLCTGGWAGTSYAAPRWAGFMALINEQAAVNGDPPVGFLAPKVYETGLGSSYGSQFHDVVIGRNDFEPGYGFYALPGYDLVTGWGSPIGQNLIDALAPQSGAVGFELTTTASGLTINPGSNATTIIGVVEVGGFSGNISLAVTSPLPSGVTASFSANPTSGTSVLTLMTTVFAVAQTFNVTVTGTCGDAQATTYLSVNIPTSAVVVLSPAVPAVPVIAELYKPSTQIAVHASVVGQPETIQMYWAPGINATSGWSTAGISLNSSLAPPYSNVVIGTWDSSSIDTAGYYTIQVSATYAEGTVSAMTLVYLEPDLVSINWPKLLDVTPGSSSGIVPVDRSNGRAGGLAFVEPHYSNLTNLAVYRLLSSDGSSDQSVTLNYGTYFSPSFGPLAPGKSSEAVVADGRTLYAVDNSLTPFPLLESSVLNADLNFSAAVLADLKGDSSLATVTYGIQTWLKTAYVIALGADGHPLGANFPIQVPYESIWDEGGNNQGVIVGDIDGDGKQEIIALESFEDSTFTLGLFANDGSPLVWNAPTFAGFPGQMILVDLDGNGKLETVIVASAPITGETTLHVLEPNGSERNGWPIAVAIQHSALLAAGDLARTGTEQIVASSGDKLFVLNGDGSSFSSAWPLTSNPFDPFSQPVLADIDGDGYPEILVTHANYSFPQDLGKLTTKAASLRTGSGMAALTTTQVNLDSNSIPAYFAPILQAFRRDGTVSRSWNLLGMNGEQPFSAPHVTVGDFDHQGMTNIAIVNGLISGGGTSGFVTRGVVEVLSTGTPFNPTANDWPMMNHDPHNSAVAYPTGPHSPRAVSPEFGTFSGAYLTPQSVVITDATPNEVIYYTTDGTTPTTSSSIYSGPITVSSSETIQAIAVASGYSESTVVSASYIINRPAATPTFSVTPGTYTSVQTVSISDSTPGAVIYYTTNGSTPTSSSTPYAGPITVSSSQTIQAIAVASGYSESAVSSASYTINLPVATPTFSVAPGTYTSTQMVAISDSTPGAVIYYTTDGSTPTTGSTPYAGPITVSTSETIQAIATASGYSESAVASATYTITPPAATPTFSVTPGTYTSTQTVAISDATPGVTIYYTTNGTTPTTSSSVYSGPITVSSTQTIEAMASGNGYSASPVASAAYTITPPAATPTFSVTPGTYISTQTVAISDSTPGVTIYYTTNGSTPTTNSSVYSGPITVSSAQTIEAMASGNGYSASAVASATYNITPPAATPTFSVTSGTYTSTQTVTISDSTPGVTIYYATNGSTPTTNSSVYSGPITVSSTQTIEAIASGNGYSASAVASATYTITPPAATPTFSVAPGTYTTTQTVAISDSTPGVTIYYTTNGTTPTTSSSVYSGPITVSSTETIEAIASGNGYSPSAVALATYTITPPAATPTFSVTPGTYTSTQIVAISDSTPGVTIYYTTNGTTPTTSSSVYSGPITVSTTEAIEAIASGNGYSPSAVASATYTITPPAATPTFSVTPGTYTSTQTVAISDATPGVTIYYTTNGSTPTTNSSVYSGPITVSSTETIEAIATGNGYSASAVASATYTITPLAATPTFSVAPGTYTSTQTVAISDSTPGVTIYYTTNGTTPTTNSSVYSSPITFSSTETIEAIASGNGYSASAVASAAYTITPPAATPTFSVTPGTYTSTQTVTISDSTPGVTIYYTSNGSTPTTSSSIYSGPITVSSTETIEAIAIGNGYSASAVASASYTITPPAATPIFSLTPGTYTSAQTVAISDATPGATIYYTTNGTTPTTSSSVYSGPITVSTTETIEAMASGNGYSASAVASAVYTITPPAATPTFSVAPGTYTSTQTVSISDSTLGVTVYFTTDGTTPNTSSSVYSGPITVSSTETIEAIAIGNGYSASTVASATYTINIPNPLPAITSTSPAYQAAGGSGFTLTVNGSGFVSGSTVYWKNAALPTQFVSGMQLTAQVPSSFIASAGVAAIEVVSPAPGGGTSGTVQFEIDSASAGSSAAPTFTTTSASVAAGETASYAVTLPPSVTTATLSCLNLPAGATCTYTPSSGAISIATSKSTPAGSYQVTAVFTETATVLTSYILLPFLSLPLFVLRRKLVSANRVWIAACLTAVLTLGTLMAAGCGGTGSISQPVQSNPTTHQLTSSGVVTLTVK